MFPLGHEHDSPNTEKQTPNAIQQDGKKEKGEEWTKEKSNFLDSKSALITDVIL